MSRGGSQTSDTQHRPEQVPVTNFQPLQRPIFKKHCTIATFNLRTVTDESRISALAAFCESSHIAIALLQETRRSEASQQPFLPTGWIWFESFASSNGVGGVAILVTPFCKFKDPIFSEIIKSRIASVTFPNTVVCLSCYAPTAFDAEEQEKFLSQLSTHIANLPERIPTIVGGDFNARPPEHLKKQGKEVRAASRRFTTFLESMDLSTQLRLQKPLQKMYTHFNATLDYFLIRNRHASALRDYKAVSPPIFSDHKLLALSFQVKWKKTPAPPRLHDPDFYSLEDEVTKQLFVDAARKEDGTITFQSLRNAFDVIPRKSNSLASRPSWYSDYVQDLMKMKAITRADEDSLLQALDVAKLQTLNDHVLAYARQLKHNPRLAWQHLREPIRARTREKFPANSKAERSSILRNHFASLLSSHGGARPEDAVVERLFPPRCVVPHFVSGPFSMEELGSVLEVLPHGKAAGPDQIPYEVYKIKDIREDVLRFVNSIQKQPEDSVKSSSFVPLPKKGDLSKPTNWRGITLEPHITKIYNKLHQIRLANALDMHLLCEQAGFRARRGTREHLMCHALLVSDARCFKSRQLFGVYVDLSKAFDSVPRWCLRASLRSWHVPEGTVEEIMQIIEGHKVTLCNSDEPIEVNVGVLQGDTLSPYLFIIVVDAILRLLYSQHGIASPSGLNHSPQIRFLAYADDMLFVCSSSHELKKLLKQWECRLTTAKARQSVSPNRQWPIFVCTTHQA